MVKLSGNKKYTTPKKNPKTARKKMTNAEKGMIIAFFYCLGSILQVARLIGSPWSTVKSFLTHATERQSLENLLRSSRPRILIPQQCRVIVQAAKS